MLEAQFRCGEITECQDELIPRVSIDVNRSGLLLRASIPLRTEKQNERQRSPDLKPSEIEEAVTCSRAIAMLDPCCL